MLGGADPVGVDCLDVPRVGLAAPAQQKPLGGGLALRDDIVRRRVAPIGLGRRAGDDLHHLRREPSEILARLLVGDLVQLAEAPDAGQPRRLRLQVGGGLAAERGRRGPGP